MAGLDQRRTTGGGEPERERTLSTSRVIPASPGRVYAAFVDAERLEECEAVRSFAAPANEENLDRLEAELARGA